MVNLTAIKNMKKGLFLLPLKKAFNQEKKYTFEEQQSLALVEIGSKLRRFREKNSICLEKVAVVTMIRINLLKAIEEGDMVKLPEPVYIQGLIKRYADTMGLNGEQLANLFPTQKTQEARKKFPLHFSIPDLRAHHLYVLYIFVIVLSVSSLHHLMIGSNLLGSNNVSKQDNQTKNQDNLVAQASSGNTENQQKPLDKTTTAKSEKQNNKKSVVVSVIFKEDCWVSIEIDGKLEFEDTLPKGTKKTWEAKEKLVFFAGNAGGILIPLSDGKTIQLGKPGEIKEVVFTATDTQVSQSKNAKN